MHQNKEEYKGQRMTVTLYSSDKYLLNIMGTRSKSGMVNGRIGFLANKQGKSLEECLNVAQLVTNTLTIFPV